MFLKLVLKDRGVWLLIYSLRLSNILPDTVSREREEVVVLGSTRVLEK